MKLQSIISAFSGTLAVAAPLSTQNAVSDTANDMSDIFAGIAPCAPVAVIFARGTFDSGNIGVWVGPQFFESLRSNIKGVALQGVDSDAYPADLGDYVGESGGSDAGAASMAQAVEDYASKCPASAIILSGWSQGAMVAHKALGILTSGETVNHIKGFITFGDPNHVWQNLSIPVSIPASSYCITGTTFDPLCASLPEDFTFPTSAVDIIKPFALLPSLAVGAQQLAAATSVLAHLPPAIISSFHAIMSLLRPSEVVRLLLTPQHFTYGNNGMAAEAAAFVANIPAVQNALGGDV